MNPFFSIIVPTKNRQSLLAVCLQSIFNQKFTNFELIVVDDNSTDTTNEYLTSLQDNRLIIRGNKGVERSEARNTGLDIASGKYVCFIDDDDYVSTEYLRDFYDAIQMDMYDENVVFRCSFQYVYENGKKPKIGSIYDTNRYKTIPHFVAFEFCGLWTLAIDIKLARKGRFDKRFPHWQDTHYLLQILNENSILIQSKSINYFYRIYPIMGKRLDIEPKALLKKAEINVEAIKDAFTQNFIGCKLLPSRTMNWLVSEKYMEYAIIALKIKHKSYDASFTLLKKSLGCGIYLKHYRQYVIYVLTFLKLK
jgi:glycosyltransferase involved in cell wall biosynthesis